jgi:hypothetical protein
MYLKHLKLKTEQEGGYGTDCWQIQSHIDNSQNIYQVKPASSHVKRVVQ